MSTNSVEAIRERRANNYVKIARASHYATVMLGDIGYLLSALEAAQQENERLRKWQAGLQATTLSTRKRKR